MVLNRQSGNRLVHQTSGVLLVGDPSLNIRDPLQPGAQPPQWPHVAEPFRLSECLGRCSALIHQVLHRVVCPQAGVSFPDISVQLSRHRPHLGPGLPFPTPLPDPLLSETVGLDAFMVSWNKWQCICLLPSLTTSLFLQSCHLHSYSERVLLITP